jgi:stage II sporulation protein AA (anti-sigma F factor antagonist)
MAEVQLSHERRQESPRVVVVRIRGEVDAVSGRTVESYFDTVLESEQPRHVLLDLEGVTFGDSAFFSSVLFWREELTKRGGKLILFAPRPELLSTMRILTLDRVLTIKPDQETALASLPREA